MSAIDPKHGQFLLSNLRNRTKPYLVKTFVLLPDAHQEITEQVPDLGANDWMVAPIETTELRIWLKMFVSRKRTIEQLRNKIQNGLKAAITNP